MQEISPLAVAQRQRLAAENPAGSNVHAILREPPGFWK